MPCPDAVPEGEQDERRGDVVEVGLDHDPARDIVSALSEVRVWPPRQRVRSGSCGIGRREEVGSDEMTELPAKRCEETGHDEGD